MFSKFIVKQLNGKYHELRSLIITNKT